MNNYWNDMIFTLKELVSYNTVLEEAQENAPFGVTNKACLDRTLSIGEEMGFTSKNVEGYAGHIEWKGESEEMLGILGHLDIVPAGDGWICDPFGCEVKDGYMYGRGVLDDKGPVVACLYAMKRLKDEGFTPKKSIRLIMGCNEENGSTCIERYFKTEKMPTVAFSPDGDFPVIHCEKGIVWAGLHMPNTVKHFSNIKGGDKTNMVAGKATCLYNGDLTADYFTENGLTATASENGLLLTAKGKSAHGSTPSKGDNAIWKLLKVINEVEDDETIKFLYNKLCQDFDGETVGIKFHDDKSGGLSCNFGTIEQSNDEIFVTLDIRYPVVTSIEEIFAILQNQAPQGTTMSIENAQDYLFVDPESELIQTLMGIYRKYTGSTTPSLIIGGGTYARLLKHGVAFGPMFEDEEATIHMPNERISLTNFERMFEIYYEAIKELSK